MGINACILGWMEELARAGVFAGCSSVVELGPQDFFFRPERLMAAARGSLGEEASASIVGRILDSATPFAERQGLFYSLFGLEHYTSTDPFDPRADHHLDLNTADSMPGPIDVVIDFGTTEHVFNAANVFVFTHNSLRVGGVSVKVLPTYGDNSHGFYNIHPTVYFDIARVNGYELLDFRYVDNMTGRTDAQGAYSLLSAEEMGPDLQSFAGCARLQARISGRFLENLTRTRDEGRLAEAHSIVDYCFVAMRKLKNGPFRPPGQGVYLTEFGMQDT